MISRGVFVSEQENALVKALFLDGGEFLVTHPQGFVEGRSTLRLNFHLLLSKSVHERFLVLFKVFDGVRVWGVQLLKHVNSLQIEGVLRFGLPEKDHANLVVVIGNNLCFYETEGCAQHCAHTTRPVVILPQTSLSLFVASLWKSIVRIL